MPDGLLAWYEEHARNTGRAVNAVLVAALEEYRRASDDKNRWSGPGEAPRCLDAE